MSSKQQANYIMHLLQVCEHQTIVAVKDIADKQGNVVLPKGDTISEHALSGVALNEPIERLIEIEGAFGAEELYSLFLEFLGSEPAFDQIVSQRDLGDKFQACFREFFSYPLLAQKLNVLAMQLPDVFDQALFSAWLSLTVLAHQNYPQSRLKAAFIAALSHDFGYLHVAPAIACKDGRLSAQEWDALKKHVAYGVDILSKEKELDKEILKAVEQHHEEPDGTGYPKGRFAKQIDDLAALLNLLDATNAIYRKHFRETQRSFHDLIPVLQLASIGIQNPHTSALFSIFNQTIRTEHTLLSSEQISGVIAELKTRISKVDKFLEKSSSFSEKVGFKHQSRDVLVMQRIAKNVAKTMDSCGIVNEAYIRWLDQVENERLEFAYRELEEVSLMVKEIQFHIQRFIRQMDTYLTKDTKCKLRKSVEGLHDFLCGIL